MARECPRNVGKLVTPRTREHTGNARLVVRKDVDREAVARREMYVRRRGPGNADEYEWRVERDARERINASPRAQSPGLTLGRVQQVLRHRLTLELPKVGSDEAFRSAIR
jgi:hypothetical protein